MLSTMVDVGCESRLYRRNILLPEWLDWYYDQYLKKLQNYNV
ncbi:hypothetical protein MPF_1494 [Methanohalophilus portucalensis FDF-1]|uniref:Uncharacterized protein n=1 Tax=Methanohalophilus portucalensis FDF-1 TaxID=523843 RepID=A0A1L9C387_9EURY|nr:hypothetical protein MPF_1494 [Methanohalophilus portucalensis FDF-1]